MVYILISASTPMHYLWMDVKTYSCFLSLTHKLKEHLAHARLLNARLLKSGTVIIATLFSIGGA